VAAVSIAADAAGAEAEAASAAADFSCSFFSIGSASATFSPRGNSRTRFEPSCWIFGEIPLAWRINTRTSGSETSGCWKADTSEIGPGSSGATRDWPCGSSLAFGIRITRVSGSGWNVV
jgi:hypothetical protein